MQKQLIQVFVSFVSFDIRFHFLRSATNCRYF